MTITRPMLTVAEAAAHCGVTTKTIQRRLAQLEELGATKDEHGRWSIPYEALLGVGLKPGKPAGPDRVDSPKDTLSVSKENVQDDVRAEMDRLRHRAELAEELLTAERQLLTAERRITRLLEDALELAKRQLPPGRTEEPAPAVTSEPATEVTIGDLEAEAEPPVATSAAFAAEVEPASNVVTITEPAAAMPAPSIMAEEIDDIEPTKPAWRRRFATFFGKNS